MEPLAFLGVLETSTAFSPYKGIQSQIVHLKCRSGYYTKDNFFFTPQLKVAGHKMVVGKITRRPSKQHFLSITYKVISEHN